MRDVSAALPYPKYEPIGALREPASPLCDSARACGHARVTRGVATVINLGGADV